MPTIDGVSRKNQVVIMQVNNMKKGFKILYFVNLGIILLALLSPIVEWTSHTAEYNWQMTYYAVVIGLSVTFCISFLGLNIYGITKYEQHRTKYLWITIFFLYGLSMGYINLHTHTYTMLCYSFSTL